MTLDTQTTPTQRVAETFTHQAIFCQMNKAPITARVVAALRDLLNQPQSEFLRQIAHWQGDPLLDALPMRAAGALHSLHLRRKTEDLAPIYANAAAIHDQLIIYAVCRRFDTQLLPWLESPPQTNELARSATFIAGLLWLAEMGLPPLYDIIEIGSSAGINLMMDRYHYDWGVFMSGRGPRRSASNPYGAATIRPRIKSLSRASAAAIKRPWICAMKHKRCA